jgi:thymidylate synthase (FAD)
MMRTAAEQAENVYRALLSKGVAREQARFVLPLNVYTSWVWTASIQAVVHFCALRDHESAQWEIQQFAKALRSLVRPLAPHSWDALWESHPVVLKDSICTC